MPGYTEVTDFEVTKALDQEALLAQFAGKLVADVNSWAYVAPDDERAFHVDIRPSDVDSWEDTSRNLAGIRVVRPRTPPMQDLPMFPHLAMNNYLTQGAERLNGHAALGIRVVRAEIIWVPEEIPKKIDDGTSHMLRPSIAALALSRTPGP